MYAPGACINQLNIWVPSKRIFFCGDVINPDEFPRLYVIGGFQLDATSWISSLDRIRKLRPHVLIPSRGRVLRGEEAILEFVTSYRDAIQFIHDQTIRLANMGHHRDTIATHLQLPPELFANGRLPKPRDPIEWSVKAVYDRCANLNLPPACN